MELSLTSYFTLALAALFGSILAGTTGFGGAAVLLPVLLQFFRIHEAIPILTVVQLIGNGSRVWFHRSHVSWRIIIWFSLGSIPMACIGGFVFANTAPSQLLKVLGLFLLATVAWRRLKTKNIVRFPIQGFAGVGAVFGFLSALVGGVGPFIVPFFLNFGLIKGAFIGTEAMATVTMHIFKMVAYRQASLLGDSTVQLGLLLGMIMILGSWLGKKIVNNISSRTFVILVEITLVIAGVNFLLK